MAADLVQPADAVLESLAEFRLPAVGGEQPRVDVARAVPLAAPLELTGLVPQRIGRCGRGGGGRGKCPCRHHTNGDQACTDENRTPPHKSPPMSAVSPPGRQRERTVHLTILATRRQRQINIDVRYI